jgi:hypothetical protein
MVVDVVLGTVAFVMLRRFSGARRIKENPVRQNRLELSRRLFPMVFKKNMAHMMSCIGTKTRRRVIMGSFSKIRLPAKTILDSGAARRSCLILAKRGYVSGMDRSASMLDIARRKADQGLKSNSSREHSSHIVNKNMMRSYPCLPS